MIMSPKVAFVVKNKFQIIQFENLFRSYPSSVLLLLDRKTLRKEFDKDELGNVEIVDRFTVAQKCAEFDVVFFQTTFPGIEEISVPLVSVQYGLAKEQHNYGDWRSLADLNLMYGYYSVRQIQHFSPSVAVGNLKFAGWNYREARRQCRDIKQELGLDVRKPAILFMPTYGSLGTFDALVESLGELALQFDVMVKMHHNNELTGREWRKNALSHGIKYLYGGDFDQKKLLSAADLVISDFSGAIFDAVYAEVPVVLFQPSASEKIGLQKFDLNSIEFSQRDNIGFHFNNSKNLSEVVNYAIVNSDALVQRASRIRSELFIDGHYYDTVSQIQYFVALLLSGEIPTLTEQQMAIRSSVKFRLRTQHKIGWREKASEILSSFSRKCVPQISR